jgi:cation diffusion facilitator CzcD-associated flavoprotein CzcO
VLVVGVGNSGAEIAVELGNAGIETGISVRSGAVFGPEVASTTTLRLAAWLARVAPTPLVDAALRRSRPDFSEVGLPLPDMPPHEAFPVVGFELPEAVRAGRVTTYRGISHMDAERVHFDDGRSAPFDTIILATGFRPAVDFAADYLELEDGRLRLDGYRSTRHRRLYAVGYDYPGTDGWLHHIDRVARRAVTQIAEAWG